LAGFVSKWYLATGALEAGHPWVIGVLAVSSLLNAAYFLPIVYRVWFWPSPGLVAGQAPAKRVEIAWSLLAPPLATAALALGVGLLAASDVSPLAWAKVIAIREFGL
jgi:multicomponent Na+:H+ antiporter subunit D